MILLDFADFHNNFIGCSRILLGFSSFVFFYIFSWILLGFRIF